MKLLILSVEAQWEIDRISKEAEKRGHSVVEKKPSKFDEKELENFDAILFRAIKGEGDRAKEIAVTAKERGIVVIDRKLGLGKAVTKLAIYSKMGKAGYYVPKTIKLNKKNFDNLKEFPQGEIVVKSTRGKRGQDLYKCRRDELKNLVPKLKKDERYIIQEFVPIQKEYRVFVIDGMVYGAYSKHSKDWKHNVSLGAKAVEEEIGESEEMVSLKAFELSENDIAGIDLAVTPNGLFVLEVNRSPGFKAFEEATGKNVAGEIVTFIEELVGE
ncbi:MAG: ATP-grasp domain-containing protein [Candidatus Diapherotrites archaeon]